MSRSIATRTGDDGTTGLLYGQRVPKDHPQIETIGAFDELNAALGFAKATAPDSPASAARSLVVRATLADIQRDLINLMGELACAETDAARYAASAFKRLTDADLARLETTLADLESQTISFDGWATPGANVHAAALDLARTAARRAERRLVSLPAQGRNVRPLLGHYTNRLSDYLWLLARQAEAPAGPGTCL